MRVAPDLAELPQVPSNGCTWAQTRWRPGGSPPVGLPDL